MPAALAIPSQLPVFQNNSNLLNSGCRLQSTTLLQNQRPWIVPHGDYAVRQREILHSSTTSSRYQILGFIGRGSFGQVVHCRKLDNNDVKKPEFAVKILKNQPTYERQGFVEMSVLSKISKEDADAHNLVRAFECFSHQSHWCIVFELLHSNLYDLLRRRHFSPLTLPQVRAIGRQILAALARLRLLGLVHGDVKPENIMLVDPVAQPWRVKLIDFGSAAVVNEGPVGIYLQSRYYRAPEIILGLPYDEGIDIWSLGCVLAELFIGWPLYPGSSEYEQLRFIADTQGIPSQHVLNVGKKTNKYFNHVLTVDGNSMWQLKSPELYCTETGISLKESRKYFFNSLEDIAKINLPANHDKQDADEIIAADRNAFVSVLRRMLSLNTSQRAVPEQALRHNFFTLVHMQDHFTSDYTQTSLKILMEVTNSRRQNTTPAGFQLPKPRPCTSSLVPLQFYSPNSLDQCYPIVPVSVAASQSYTLRPPMMFAPYVIDGVPTTRNYCGPNSQMMGQILSAAVRHEYPAMPPIFVSHEMACLNSLGNAAAVNSNSLKLSQINAFNTMYFSHILNSNESFRDRGGVNKRV